MTKITHKSIVEKIISGLKEAVYLSSHLKNGDFTNLKPEYILTTLVARSLSDITYNRSIKIEESTKTFSTHCVPQHTKDLKFSGLHNVNRTGLIDIALYNDEKTDHSWFRSSSFAAIELKGINPRKEAVMSDIFRNIEYFSFNDSITGSSCLKYAFFATVMYNEKIQFREHLSRYINRIKKLYGKRMMDTHPTLEREKLQYEIHVEALESNLFDIIDIGTLEAEDYYDCHCYLGVVVTIKRKSL